MTTENEKLKWYALKVTANQERKVKEYIDKKVKIDNMERFIPKVIIPMEKYLSVDTNGKKSVRERLVLPGYLLIQADLTHGEVEPTLSRVSGTFGFLSMTEGKVTTTPSPLRQREVDRFLKVYEEPEEITWEFQVGDQVKLLSGAFNGFEGTIETIDEQKKHLYLIVMIFGRETKVDVPMNQVEKIQTKK